VLDCGCDLVARPRAVGPGHILRPALLAAMALGVAILPPFASDTLAGDVLAAFGALALYLAALEILAIPYPRWRMA
jgi:hypothetical protein